MNTISLGQKKYCLLCIYIWWTTTVLCVLFLDKTEKKTPDSGFLACDLTNTGIMSSVPKSKRPHQRDPWLIIAKMLNVFIEQAVKCMQDQGCFAALVDRVSQSSVQLHEQDY